MDMEKCIGRIANFIKETGKKGSNAGALKWENQYKLKINENISLDSIYLK